MTAAALLLAQYAFSQVNIGGIVNAYTSVVAINSTTNTLSVASAASFSVGDRVVLHQARGATYVTANNTSYGDLISSNQAGTYEWNTICSISGNDIQLAEVLAHTFDPAGTVQLVRAFRAENATVTSALTPAAWNGAVGGILALEIDSTLTLNANLEASATGFRGGSRSVDFYNPSLCTRTDFFYTIGSGLAGFKGEGIGVATTGQETGQGKLVNGGGGGNHTNAGGGGGGNAGNGGNAGQEWGGCSVVVIGGVGGQAVMSSNANERVLMGAGGGGGHQNNSVGGSGGNGGGIIMVRANAVEANGFAIRSNGGGPLAAGIDGGGGGGAGGTVLLEVNGYVGALTVDVQGANGGTCAANHGSGGGGGGGYIWHSGATLPANVTTSVGGGAAGLTAANQTRGSQPGGAGAVLSGLTLATGGAVFPGCDSVLSAGGPLLRGLARGEGMDLTWEFPEGIHPERLWLERRMEIDGEGEGVGISPQLNHYHDPQRHQAYRLVAEYPDGDTRFSNLLLARDLFPRPQLLLTNPQVGTDGIQFTLLDWPGGATQVSLLHPDGRILTQKELIGDGRIDGSLGIGLPGGIYLLRVSAGREVFHRRVFLVEP